MSDQLPTISGDSGPVEALPVMLVTPGGLPVTPGVPAAVSGGPFVLLTNAAATGNAVATVAGRYNWVIYGTWGGATAQLQFSPNAGATWINVDDAAQSADGGFSDIPLSQGSHRVVLTGASGSTSLSSTLFGVG